MARRKSRTTPEQREARRKADADLIEAAGARFDGDEPGDELAALIAARPGLARLSVKNCALLAEQADMRGADIADVRTFAGWLAAGRAVRKGSRAYKLIVPRHDDQSSADGAEGADAGGEAPAGDEGKPARPRFFLKAGWFDISQTDPVEAVPAETDSED